MISLTTWLRRSTLIFDLRRARLGDARSLHRLHRINHDLGVEVGVQHDNLAPSDLDRVRAVIHVGAAVGEGGEVTPLYDDSRVPRPSADGYVLYFKFQSGEDAE